MAARHPPETLVDYLPCTGCDIYAFGVQESNYTLKEGEGSCVLEHLEEVFLASVGDPGTYKILTRTETHGIRLVVCIRSELAAEVAHVETGNYVSDNKSSVTKGANVVSFRLFGSWICMVNCHLPAHAHQVEARDRAVAELLRDVRLGPHKDVEIDAQHAFVFWFGDLNYRIDLEYWETVSLVEKRDWVTLRDADQLLKAVAEKRMFVGYDEGNLSFCPSYKYSMTTVPGDKTTTTTTTTTRPYELKDFRVPSWTDRVLWRTLPGHSISQTMYTALDSCVVSDHAPVVGAFVVHVDAVPWEGPDHVTYQRATVVLQDLVCKDTSVKWSLRSAFCNANTVVYADKEGILRLRIAVPTLGLEHLQRQCVVLAAEQEGTLFGAGAISLRDADGGTFSCPLTLGTAFKGMVSGRISLELEKETT